ncbi:Uncharacterized protein dnm_055740 [Desulfonema magnum]|uniref:Uncharacterized protein n=1 Tax=Desulfonema magnum TaxID=45655 RepID=A0A975GR04_9BACT|nr:Uncharacterized protein dnm_055740 [Desulfonema magnum]
MTYNYIKNNRRVSGVKVSHNVIPAFAGMTETTMERTQTV